MTNSDNANVLAHHGVLGQKWGVRRYQNKDGSYTNAGRKRHLKEMQKDMDATFKSKISKEAAKVTSIGRNGHDVRGNAWNKAYRAGKVTNKDDAQIKKAAKETREYMKNKYGEDAVKALAKSGVLSFKVDSFEIKNNATKGEHMTKQMDLVKKLSKEMADPMIHTDKGPMRLSELAPVNNKNNI